MRSELRFAIFTGTRDGIAQPHIELGVTLAQSLANYDIAVVGSLQGVDGQVFWFHIESERDVLVMPARWSTTPGMRSAGPKRNARMDSTVEPCAVFSFGGGNGTMNMQDVARRSQRVLWLYNPSRERWEPG